MKKIIVSLICVFLVSGSAFAKETAKQTPKTNVNNVKTGVYQYKKGDYIGSMQTMEEVVKTDPGNALAHYYLAISYVKVGKAEKARGEYQKVITLKPSSELAFYSNLGLKNLDTPSATPITAPENTPSELPSMTPPPEADAMGKNSPTSGFMTEQVKDTLIEKNINNVINEVNQNGSVDPEKLKRINDLTKKKSENSMPSGEEIAQALQVLSKAGLSTNSNPYQNINPEMMQLNMMMGLMGGSGNNTGNNMNYNPMNMMPFMNMLSQNPENAKNIDPQLMENMVTGMIMPNMFSLTNSNNNNY